MGGFRSPWVGAHPLAGKTALVTGAARGIGRGIAEELAAAGADVIAADLDEAELEGSSARFVRLDVTDPASVARCFGSTAVDLVVNAAGVLSVAPVVELELEEWDRVMDVNARGVFVVSRAAVRAMIDRRDGAIVNVSSVSGKDGEPTLAHYSASKFAVIGFTQSLAKEVAQYGIRVNAVCPGVVRTPMIEQVADVWNRSADEIAAELQLIKAPQHPREIGAAVVFLAVMPSITGQAINVDGGTVFH